MPDVKPDIKDRKPATQDESEVPDGKVQITVILGEQTFKYAVKPTTAFKKVFETTEKQVAASPGTLRFHYNGQRLRPQQTLEEIEAELDEPVEFHAQLEQIGGA